MIPFALKASAAGLAAAVTAGITLMSGSTDTSAENTEQLQPDNYQSIAPVKQQPVNAQVQPLSAPIMSTLKRPVKDDLFSEALIMQLSPETTPRRPALVEQVATVQEEDSPAIDSNVDSLPAELPVTSATGDSTVSPTVENTNTPPLSAVPPGFESLAAAQTTMADVFYGGRPIGMMQVIYTPDTVTISSPADIIRRIPDIKNPDEVETALTGEISSNVSARCITARDTRCGVLTPEVAGVIYNAGQFRLDVFIAEDQLQTRSLRQDKFLPESTSNLGMIHGLRATASGTSGTANDSNSYTLFGNSLIGWRENHLVSDWDYSDENGFSVETLFAQRDANGMQYGAGFLDSNSSLSPEFSAGRRILGARIGTSDNSRTDQAGMSATPLQIFASGRSRVEVFRDDRLIYATTVEAGSQELDTGSFPIGAYEVTIKIYEGAALTQELTRFFVKSRRIPPSDEFHWHLEAGEMLSRSGDKTMPGGTDEYLVRGALAFQVAGSTGLSMIGSNTSHERTLETELYHQGQGWDLAATGMLGNNSAKGLALETTYSLGLMYGNYYYRRLWNDQHDPLNSQHVLLGESYETHNLSASAPLYDSILTYTFSHNKDLNREENTTHSLSWFKNIWNYQTYSLSMRLNYSQSESNKLGMVELTLRNRGRNWNYNVKGQSRWKTETVRKIPAMVWQLMHAGMKATWGRAGPSLVSIMTTPVMTRLSAVMLFTTIPASAQKFPLITSTQISTITSAIMDALIHLLRSMQTRSV